jgi:DNA-binding Xre family transcriptional regulator
LKTGKTATSVEARRTAFKAYPTRIDRFRVKEGIDVTRWYTEAGLTRSFFSRIRAGHDFSVDTLLRLLKAAREITGKRVRATDIADLGEDMPPPGNVSSRLRRRPQRQRTAYETELDRIMAAHRLSNSDVMREARLSKPTLLKMRQGRIKKNGKVVITTGTLAAVVRALRALTGEPIGAADITGIEELRG